MRLFSFSLISSLAIAFSALGQGVQPPQPPAQQSGLDTVLRGWEKAMTDLRTFVAEVDRRTLDKSIGTNDSFKGYAMFKKAEGAAGTSRARLELAKVSNPSQFEKFICTGVYLYEYAPVNKKVRVHNMPQQNGQQQESFLSFLFGMGANQAKQRYDMVLGPESAADKTYNYIHIKPKTLQDKTDFTQARLALYKSNNLPAQIWYHQPNGNEITWNFTKLQIDVQIPNSYFEPTVPLGWVMERVQQKGPNAAPVVRKAGQ